MGRDPRRHRKTLRMGSHVFDLLLAEVALILWAPTSSNGKSISVIDKLCIFLNWAGAATGLNDLSNIWGVSQTSCTEAINFVIDRLYDSWVDKYVRFPGVTRCKDIAEGFSKMSGFPAAVIVMAIDGFHTSMNPPGSDRDAYKNHYQRFRYTLIIFNFF